MLLLYAAVGYVAFAAFAWFMADRMMFLPPPSSYRPGDLPTVLVPTDDGSSVAVLYLPNDTSRLTLLFSHGNAEDLGHVAPSLPELRDQGFSVLAYDYRGYGLSTGGAPTTRGAIRDAEAVYRYAVDSLRIDPKTLVLHGRSVGTGPATDLASRLPVGGLVIESGFVSAFLVMTRVPLLPFDRFPNERNLARVSAPVLVIHGTEDEVIGFWHGRRLFAAAPAEKYSLWVDGAHHNDLAETAGDRYLAALRAFGEVVSRVQGQAP